MTLAFTDLLENFAVGVVVGEAEAHMGATGRRWVEEEDVEAARSSVGIAHAKQLTFAQVNLMLYVSEKRSQFATLGDLFTMRSRSF